MKTFLSRRDFFKLLAYLLGALGLGGLIRFLSYKTDAGIPTEFNLGSASDFPPGSKTIRRDIPAVIENRNGDWIATSLTCTHLGCTLDSAEDGFACACHGSQFEANGSVRAGPASESLRKLKIEIKEDQTLVLYTNEGR